MTEEVPEEETWLGRIEGALQGVSDWTGIPVEWLKKVLGIGALGAVAYIVLKVIFGRK